MTTINQSLYVADTGTTGSFGLLDIFKRSVLLSATYSVGAVGRNIVSLPLDPNTFADDVVFATTRSVSSLPTTTNR